MAGRGPWPRPGPLAAELLQSRRWAVEGAARLCCGAGAGAGLSRAAAPRGPGQARPCWECSLPTLLYPRISHGLVHTSMGQGQLVIKEKSLCLRVACATSNLCPPSVMALGAGKRRAGNLQQSFLRNECCCFYIVLEQKPACALCSLFAGVKYCFIDAHFFPLPRLKDLP